MGQIQPVAFFCKQSFIGAQLHLFVYMLFMAVYFSHTTMAQLNSSDRDNMASKIWNIHCLAVCRKGLLIFGPSDKSNNQWTYISLSNA